jgi:hypothetical protein
MPREAQDAAGAKREVFAALEKAVKLDASGKEAAEEIWRDTLGHFFDSADRPEARWSVKRVHDYGLSAVRDIGEEAKRLAGRGAAGRKHLEAAAQLVIAKYRPPTQIIPRPNEGCLFCEDYKLKIDIGGPQF